MDMNIEFDPNTDMVQAQEMVFDMLKKGLEDAGSTSIETWETLKAAHQNGTIILCQLIDREIAKLKSEIED